MMSTHYPLQIAFRIFLLAPVCCQAQTTAPVDSKTVPVIDGGIGPCSADFTVIDNAGAPIYAANIRSTSPTDSCTSTSWTCKSAPTPAGKARFTGLPDRTKQGLFFRASEGGREGSAFVDPAKTCKADLTITLEKKPQ